MGGIIASVVVGIAVILAINVILAYMMNNAAILKGYGKEAHAWAMCFWLGILGCLYVVALPDKIAQSQNQQIINLMKGRKA